MDLWSLYLLNQHTVEYEGQEIEDNGSVQQSYHQNVLKVSNVTALVMAPFLQQSQDKSEE